MFGTREGMARDPATDTMRFADGVTWRISQRGLVVCGPGDAPLLVEHARAADLPEFVAGAIGADDLAASLGGSDADSSSTSWRSTF